LAAAAVLARIIARPCRCIAASGMRIIFLMSSWLWLLSYGHGSRRFVLRDAAADDDADEKGEDSKRSRCILPNVRAVARHCSSTDLRISDDQANNSKLVGLIKVSPGRLYNGILTPWTDEEQALHAYFKEDPSAYSLNVESAFEIEHTLDPIHVKYVRGPLNESVKFRLDRHSVGRPTGNLSNIRVSQSQIIESVEGEADVRLAIDVIDCDLEELRGSEPPRPRVFKLLGHANCCRIYG
jgi:hypothetical protein